MDPLKLIRKDLGEDAWNARDRRSYDTSPDERISPLRSPKIYRFFWATGQFDFPCLPDGSYCVYAADGWKAIRLTRAGKEIESILAAKWPELSDCDPVRLADLILMFYDGGIKHSHSTLPNADALYPSDKYRVVDEAEMTRIRDSVGTTQINVERDTVVIRAVTLCGWMHEAQNLGIEHIHIPRSGKVQFDARQTLSKKIFSKLPDIYY